MRSNGSLTKTNKNDILLNKKNTRILTTFKNREKTYGTVRTSYDSTNNKKKN